MLVDKILHIVREQMKEKSCCAITKDDFYHVWLELAQQKVLFYKSRNLFGIGFEYEHIKKTLEGFGFIISYIGDSFLIERSK